MLAFSREEGTPQEGLTSPLKVLQHASERCPREFLYHLQESGGNVGPRTARMLAFATTAFASSICRVGWSLLRDGVLGSRLISRRLKTSPRTCRLSQSTDQRGSAP